MITKIIDSLASLKISPFGTLRLLMLIVDYNISRRHSNDHIDLFIKICNAISHDSSLVNHEAIKRMKSAPDIEKVEERFKQNEVENILYKEPTEGFAHFTKLLPTR